VGGKWNGTTFLEGHAMSEEIESIEHASTTAWRSIPPGWQGSYASYAMRKAHPDPEAQSPVPGLHTSAEDR
jgi:hypothetical protein